MTKQLLTLAFLIIFLMNKGNSQNLKLDSNLGYKNAQKVAAEMILYKDVEKTAYIKKVGDRLIASLEKPLFPYQFHIIADPMPNAFALPGGYIYVTTGLIILLENEDELACVLGHEIIHSNNRHGIKQIKKSIFPKMLEIPGELIGVVTPLLGSIINAPLKGINSFIFAAYGKSSENEADKLGTALAARAGYNPLALNPILARLEMSIENISGEQETKSYLSDHPYTPKRIERIQENGKKLDWKKTEEITNDIAKEFNGILVGYSPETGIINSNHFSHPSLNFKIDFPKDWKLENTNEAVGAYTEDKNGIIAITIAKKQTSPKEAADKYLSGLSASKKALITSSDTANLNGLTAYIITLKKYKGKDTATAQLAWVQLDSTLISISGLATSKYNSIIEKSLKSIAPLSDTDRKNLTYKTLKVVPATASENIKELSDRSNNTLTIEVTEIINAVKSDQKLTEGKSIKIAIDVPYLVE